MLLVTGAGHLNWIAMNDSITQSIEAGEAEAFFRRVFADSEGEEEGRSVGLLAGSLLRETPESDLRAFGIRQEDQLLACILFTRLRLACTASVFLLAPVAVSTAHQRQGIGQRLICHGLEALRREGVALALTYGDPAYYRRVGFCQIGVDTVPPPQRLSMPEGWLAQGLDGRAVEPLRGPSRCVEALNRPELW